MLTCSIALLYWVIDKSGYVWEGVAGMALITVVLDAVISATVLVAYFDTCK